jgi:hypothetical protein
MLMKTLVSFNASQPIYHHAPERIFRKEQLTTKLFGPICQVYTENQQMQRRIVLPVDDRHRSYSMN